MFITQFVDTEHSNLHMRPSEQCTRLVKYNNTEMRTHKQDLQINALVTVMRIRCIFKLLQLLCFVYIE